MQRFCLRFLFLVAALLPGGCGSAERDLPDGWYSAGSRLPDDEALGGFGPCNNFPKKCAKDFPGVQGQLTLVAYPAEFVDFGKKKAMLLRLVNRTDKVLKFSACDSRLYIVQEALDSTGQWKALEKYPTTFCGNSFHRVSLEPNEYWEFFALPRQGSFPTKLRFHLESGGEKGAGSGGALNSNEYEGSINPASFVQAAKP